MYTCISQTSRHLHCLPWVTCTASFCSDVRTALFHPLRSQILQMSALVLSLAWAAGTFFISAHAYSDMHQVSPMQPSGGMHGLSMTRPKAACIW